MNYTLSDIIAFWRVDGHFNLELYMRIVAIRSEKKQNLGL